MRGDRNGDRLQGSDIPDDFPDRDKFYTGD
jgi:hypothetical protein